MEKPIVLSDKFCLLCRGSGQITDIPSGMTNKCSVCNGTGQNKHLKMQAETEGGIVLTPLELINQMRQLSLETIRTRLEMLYKKYPETYKAVVKVLQAKK